MNNRLANFFERFKLNIKWLNTSPEYWDNDPDYIQDEKIVQSLNVVNNIAERNVKLFEEFNPHLTKDED